MNDRYLYRAKRTNNGEWKEYPECHTYGANAKGEICSFNYKNTGRTEKLIQHTDEDGYLYVRMIINGKKVKRLSHRVVLSCFSNEVMKDKEVNHKNGIRNDNRLENLEWCTHKENVIHSFEVLNKKNSEKQIEFAKEFFSGENNPKAKITKEIARKIIEDRNRGMLLKELKEKYNISISQISAICRGKYWDIDNPELLEVGE